MRTDNPITRWRDSIYYSAVLARSLTTLSTTGSIKLAFTQAAALTFGREVVRTIAWGMHDEFGLRPPVKVGARSPQFNAEQFKAAASFGASVAIAVATAPGGGMGVGGTLFWGTLGGVGLIRAGGLSGVVRAYKQMWNWPGDQGGDGGLGKFIRETFLTPPPLLRPQRLHSPQAVIANRSQL